MERFAKGPRPTIYFILEKLKVNGTNYETSI